MSLSPPTKGTRLPTLETSNVSNSLAQSRRMQHTYWDPSTLLAGSSNAGASILGSHNSSSSTSVPHSSSSRKMGAFSFTKRGPHQIANSSPGNSARDGLMPNTPAGAGPFASSLDDAPNEEGVAPNIADSPHVSGGGVSSRGVYEEGVGAGSAISPRKRKNLFSARLLSPEMSGLLMPEDGAHDGNQKQKVASHKVQSQKMIPRKAEEPLQATNKILDRIQKIYLVDQKKDDGDAQEDGTAAKDGAAAGATGATSGETQGEDGAAPSAQAGLGGAPAKEEKENDTPGTTASTFANVDKRDLIASLQNPRGVNITGEEAIAFFAKNGSNTELKFVYCNRKPTNWLKFEPYELVVVSEGQVNPEYFTVSATGVVHICPGQPSEQIPLAKWCCKFRI